MPHPNSLLSLLAGGGGGGSSDDANNNKKDSGDSILATTRQQIRRIKSLERSNAAAKDRRITDLENEINALRAARQQQNIMNEIQVRQLRQQKNMVQDRANCLQADFDNKQSLAQYASAVKRSTSDTEYTDSSYVLRLQAQLAKSMHQAAMAQKQAKIISEHCRTIVNDVNAELAEVMENKSKTEVKLRNRIAAITKENTELAHFNQLGETVLQERGAATMTSAGASSSSHQDFGNFKHLVTRKSHTTPILTSNNGNNDIHNEWENDDNSHSASSTMSSAQEQDLVQTEPYYEHVKDEVRLHLEDSDKADTSINEARIPCTIVVRRCSNETLPSSSASTPTAADQAAGISSTSTRTTCQQPTKVFPRLLRYPACA